jgi:hypothetical protein
MVSDHYTGNLYRASDLCSCTVTLFGFQNMHRMGVLFLAGRDDPRDYALEPQGSHCLRHSASIFLVNRFDF